MVFEKYLKEKGFKEKAVECVCPHCVTVSDFAREHPKGRFVLMCNGQAIVVINGCYFDANDSGNEIVLYYYEGEDDV